MDYIDHRPIWSIFKTRMCFPTQMIVFWMKFKGTKNAPTVLKAYVFLTRCHVLIISRNRMEKEIHQTLEELRRQQDMRRIELSQQQVLSPYPHHHHHPPAVWCAMLDDTPPPQSLPLSCIYRCGCSVETWCDRFQLLLSFKFQVIILQLWKLLNKLIQIIDILTYYFILSPCISRVPLSRW